MAALLEESHSSNENNATEETAVTMSKQSIKRLQKDIVDIIKHPLTEQGIYYTHDSDNFLKGYAMVIGPDDSLYRYGAYFFKFKFPTNYPFSPPKLTYLTNDGHTRFHPNLYRNGKVCISILNTWRGEQWTSCQSIRSVLLMLITLLDNKPLLNEPGIKESHRSFIPYNKIIEYKNLEVAISAYLENPERVGQCSSFIEIYKNYIRDHKDNILEYVKSLEKKNKSVTTQKASIYGMKSQLDYSILLNKCQKAIENI